MTEQTIPKKSKSSKRLLIAAAATLAIGGGIVNAALTNEGEGLLGEGVKMMLPQAR